MNVFHQRTSKHSQSTLTEDLFLLIYFKQFSIGLFQTIFNSNTDSSDFATSKDADADRRLPPIKVIPSNRPSRDDIVINRYAGDRLNKDSSIESLDNPTIEFHDLPNCENDAKILDPTTTYQVSY